MTPPKNRDRVTLTAECKECGYWCLDYPLHDDNSRGGKVTFLSTCCKCTRVVARWQQMDDGGWALTIQRREDTTPASHPIPSRTPKRRV